MDIQLPEVSGLEATKWLKEDDQLRKIRWRDCLCHEGDEERIREGGCEACIPKPTLFDVPRHRQAIHRRTPVAVP
jgi:two-component system cell cycle response regulator DivK